MSITRGGCDWAVLAWNVNIVGFPLFKYVFLTCFSYLKVSVFNAYALNAFKYIQEKQKKKIFIFLE